MGKLTKHIDYENLRNARILENQARLASIGLEKTISDLRSVATLAKPVKKYCKKVQDVSSLRRSSRLSKPGVGGEESYYSGERENNRAANAALVRIKVPHLLSPKSLARRCLSPGRGGVHHPFFGICCHYCRQKKLCGEEDCKRCGNLDMNQTCIGKTDCSVCHSSNGVLCRACLKVRYGEDLEEVRENKEWKCPHCIEEKGVKPYWICNSSLCLKKRKMAPTGLAIYKARQMGYKSVAHLLMDKLQRADKH